MSRGGRWRRLLAAVRIAGIVALVGGVGWGGWMIAAALRDSPHMPAAAKAVAMRPPKLERTDGVLDDAWLARTLSLRPGISLMELDLEALRARLLTDGQVATATLTRKFPDLLLVYLTERMPVARLRVAQGAQERDLLVARDGATFAGSGFEPAMLDALPWLAGVAVIPEAGRLQPIPHMDVVAQFLADAQLAAEHLYRTWRVISLARFDADKEIEVTTRDGSVVVFSAKGGFFVQLAKLDYIVEKLAQIPSGPMRIDLSLEREVPVRPLTEAPGARGNAAVGTPGFSSPFPSLLQREL
jgi:cell division protein FtsQ